MNKKLLKKAVAQISMLIAKAGMTCAIVIATGAQAQLTPNIVKSRTTGAGFTWTMDGNFETAITGPWTNNNDIARFDASAGGLGYPVGVSSSAGAIGFYAMTFGNAAGNWAFYGDPLTVGPGGITNSLTGATYGLTISNNVVLAASQTWLIKGHNRDNFKVMGDISSLSGQTDLILDGCSDGGTFRLFGANTFNGAVTLQNTARLYLDYSMNPDSTKINPAYPLTIKNGGRVEWGGSATVFTQNVNGLVLEGNGQTILRRENNTSVLNVGPITRTSDFSTLAVDNVTGGIITTTDNTSGILGPWAVYGGNWVYVSGSDVIGYSSGTVQNDPTQWTATYNANVNASLTPAPTSALSLNTLRLGMTSGAKAVDLNGQTLTVNGVVAGNGENAILNGTLQSGLSSGALFLMCSSAMTNAAVVQDNGAIPTVLVKGGMDNQRLSLTGANTYTGDTYIHEGLVSLSGNGRLGTGTVYVKSRYNDNTPLTAIEFFGNCPNLTTVKSVQGSILTIQHSGTGGQAALTVQEASAFYRLAQNNAGGSFTFTADGAVTATFIQPLAAGELVLKGASTLTNRIGSLLNINTGVLRVQSGNWVMSNGIGVNNTGAQMRGTNYFENCYVYFPEGRYASTALMSLGDGAVFQIGGNRWALGTEQLGATTSFEAEVLPGATFELFNLSYGASVGGANASNIKAWFRQKGGRTELGVKGGTNKDFLFTTYNSAGNESGLELSGGELLVAGKLYAGAGLLSQFIWTGGALSVSTLETANFISNGQNSTVVNQGGELLPGGKGVPGRTTITGAYQDVTTAGLSINISGATAASSFQSSSTYGNVYLNNNGNATFQGRLLVNVLNNYQPLNSTTFDIITTGSGCTLTANFSNLSSGKVTTQDGLYVFDVTVTATKVTLTNCQRNEWVGGTSGVWATAANWALGFVPDTAAEWAYLGTSGLTRALSLGSSAISLMGMTVDAQSSPYTVTGTGLLTFLNASGISLNMLSGEATLNVPIALSNATTFAVDGTSVLTLAGPVTGAQDVTKTGTGTLALGGANTFGALTVSAGTAKQAGGTTTLASLALTGGAYDLWAGTLRIAEGAAGGAIDTIAEVEAAITAGTIKGRGQTVPIASFRISVVGGFVTVELKTRGTVISFL